MSHPAPDLLEAPRLPALLRGICLYAGLPLPPATPSLQRFIVRSGTEPPELLARLLQEGLVDDGIEVAGAFSEVAFPMERTARVIVLPGYAAPCPDTEELRQAVASKGEPVLIFAVEHRDETGKLLGMTWAAVPEEEPPPQGRFRAAVRSYH